MSGNSSATTKQAEVKFLTPLPSIYFALAIASIFGISFLGRLSWTYAGGLIIAVLVLAGFDYYKAVAEPRLRFIYNICPVWPVQVPGRYQVSIANTLRRKVRVTYAEDTSDILEKEVVQPRLILGRGQTRVLSVKFVAKSRGTQPLMKSYVRFESPLRLWLIGYVIMSNLKLKIYPNISDYVAYEPFQHRRRLYQMGEERTRYQGDGTDFESLREYHSGDDYKKVNWKATARLSKPVVSIYRAEQNREVIVVVDSGRTSLQEIEGRCRLDIFLDAVTQMSYTASLVRDKLGFIAFDGEIRLHLPPTKVPNLLPYLYGLKPNPVDADYYLLYGLLASKYSKHLSLLILTEFSDTTTCELAL